MAQAAKDSPLDTQWTPLRLPDGPKRRNLVVVRTGNASLHRQWEKTLQGDRSWDLLLSHYGAGTPDCADAEIVVRQGAYKFSSFHRLYQDIAWLGDYDAVWLCDDDIMTCWADINELFAVFHRHGLELAQPTLTANSEYSHRACLQQPQNLMRFTSFVEIMVPVFSAAALKACLPTFAEAVTGWGLDVVWPHLLGAPRTRIAMIDAVAVFHTRRPLTGAVYDQVRALSLSPQQEMADNLARHGLEWAIKEYGALYRDERMVHEPPSSAHAPEASRGNKALRIFAKLIRLR